MRKNKHGYLEDVTPAGPRLRKVAGYISLSVVITTVIIIPWFYGVLSLLDDTIKGVCP
jgi:hypothetical protein